MEQQEVPTGPVRRRRTGQVVGAVVVALLVIGGFANGPGAGVAMLGFVALVAGGWAMVRGKASWVHLATRRAGLVVGVAGLAAFVAGTAVSPAPKTNDASASAAATPSSAARAPVEAAPPRSSAPTVNSAPSTQVAPPNTPPPTRPPAPTMALTCPSGGSSASPSFGQRISATAPYTVDIDYGDGDRYRNDDQHLAAVFAHTYRVTGNFTISALLTDGAGRTTSASCVYSWAKPAPAAVPSPRTSAKVVPGPSSASSTSTATSGSGSPSGGDTYTNVDGNQVHVPVQAPSAPAGATAHCRDGSWSFSQHRSGTCSGHGGVAEWL